MHEMEAIKHQLAELILLYTNFRRLIRLTATKLL